ncbi:hypothetical protein [Streptomyces sp. NPDC014894]|uniref:hypothetical protein n=1 Tax=Streptomyces sp. NPDC014894 TaxID=3364931 RepID=UPI0036F6CCCD
MPEGNVPVRRTFFTPSVPLLVALGLCLTAAPASAAAFESFGVTAVESSVTIAAKTPGAAKSGTHRYIFI